MKTYYNFLVLSLSIILVLCSCTNKPVNKEHKIYNGIDSQILNIVDSIHLCCKEKPFITISFSYCDKNNYVIIIFEGVNIPAPPMPPEPNRKILISESNGFLGYKKYKDIYLVFRESNPNEHFEKFVERDSLYIDEIPFTKFNVYENIRRNADCTRFYKRYLINENDSLVLYDGKCMFDDMNR